MIYPNYKAASDAYKELNDKINDLLEEYCARFESDSCSGVWITVEYYDANGAVRTYYGY